MAKNNTVTMEGVRIIHRNFTGRAGRYNREGVRGFSVLLDEKTAKMMEKDGWNVKWLSPREDEEGSERQPFLPVAVKYEGARPPRVVLVTSRGRTHLNEDNVEVLDWADIINVDLIVNPYTWDVNGNSGVKAYLQSLYVTIQEDELELKYADLDMLPSRSGRVDD